MTKTDKILYHQTVAKTEEMQCYKAVTRMLSGSGKDVIRQWQRLMKYDVSRLLERPTKCDVIGQLQRLRKCNVIRQW